MSELGELRRRIRGGDPSGLPEVRDALHQYIARQPAEAEAWRLLSQVEQGLYDLPAALRSQERVLELSRRPDRKDQKRLVRLKEAIAEFARLGLTPQEVDALREWLAPLLDEEECDHSHRWTRQWLQEHGHPDPESILEALRDHGGHCDCEVAANVCDAFR